MTARQFELNVFRRKGNDYGLSFLEQPSRNDKGSGKAKARYIKIWGLSLKVMTEILLNMLKKNGYRATMLSPDRTDPFILDEPSGVRLGLYFFALKPLRKISRMEEIIACIERMSDEEAYYWYAKCINGRNAQRSRKALRILLSEE